MFSGILSPAFLVLHTGHSVTLVEYLSRVLLSLLAVTGIGIGVFCGVRAVELARSAVSERWGVGENDP